MAAINNLILVGFMGTGKTTIGSNCALKLGWDFLDLDQEIENQTGESIPEIFRIHGEEYFRNQETLILSDALKNSKQVISTGGGIVVQPENRGLLNRYRQQGDRVIWLTADNNVIFNRVGVNSNRPLLSGDNPLTKINQLVSQRQKLYQEVADATIDTSYLPISEIVDLIIKMIHQ